MAVLVINGSELSEKLCGFRLVCKECGSRRVTLDIDWAAYPSCSWFKVIVICEDCKYDEVLYDV